MPWHWHKYIEGIFCERENYLLEKTNGKKEGGKRRRRMEGRRGGGGCSERTRSGGKAFSLSPGLLMMMAVNAVGRRCPQAQKAFSSSCSRPWGSRANGEGRPRCKRREGRERELDEGEESGKKNIHGELKLGKKERESRWKVRNAIIHMYKYKYMLMGENILCCLLRWIIVMATKLKTNYWK